MNAIFFKPFGNQVVNFMTIYVPKHTSLTQVWVEYFSDSSNANLAFLYPEDRPTGVRKCPKGDFRQGGGWGAEPPLIEITGKEMSSQLTRSTQGLTNLHIGAKFESMP